MHDLKCLKEHNETNNELGNYRFTKKNLAIIFYGLSKDTQGGSVHNP